jgi:hypothetical protein
MASSRLLQVFAKQSTQIQERLLVQLKGLTNQFPENGCPTKEELLIIINKRNALAGGINQLQNQIVSVGRINGVINKVTTPIPPAINLIKFLPIPTTLPGLTAGNIVVASGILSDLKDLAQKFNAIGEGFGILYNFIFKILNNINASIKILDNLIEKCAIELDIEYEIINNELNSLSNENLGEGFGVYKGFTFEIKYAKLNETPYPKRFAQARNSAGIVTLTSDESFASDPNVLVNELKFIIDTQNLKG